MLNTHQHMPQLVAADACYKVVQYRTDIVRVVTAKHFICKPGSSQSTKFKAANAPFDHSGYYSLWIESFNSEINSTTQFYPGPLISGTTTFMNTHGYLSAALWPERTFYGIMGLLYLGLGLIWTAYLACYYKDLLRVQFWIGFVVFLGMLEMSVSFGDLDHINKHGTRSHGVMIFAKLLFAAKNTAARLLALVVSMGYGIVKPRIGESVKQVVAIGVAYFFFAATYGITHAQARGSANDNADVITVVPMSIIDAALIWWIFMSLAHTMKILSLRNNEVKLQLYTRFQWCLILCVAATIIFIVWSLIDENVRDSAGEDDWRNEWWQEGFWHLLFFAILSAIMVLWRPTQNNQRYAYTALDNDDDDEDDFEVVPNFQQDAMKMRNLQSRNQPARMDFDEDDDEDLRWVEENLPSVVANADSGFGNLPMDSDEELMHTRFELSKMD
ncbi:uncharacterized protein MONBRDRAFT_35943 [Monosiga brevicollis MX1]|uniref:GOST seven transmembrane domain-containing protein n=1 Tax=Monosiga brevicollis TaxID=81824 RepID=A9USS6_MONBE|nr:uncharacterized protein MONBRDRAFT_35943 [Monosiga brevicollis MX1]EDQ92154.1 predicted protein [Monosiga brevicollis MX1]|eukprot:XP_001743440.1 hypothetical protein [Monosiga brevicollis MX1]